MNGWRIALGFLLLGLSAVAIGVLLRSRLARRWIVSLCVGGVFLVVLGSAMAAAGLMHQKDMWRAARKPGGAFFAP